jgi:hypothetical protein
MSSSAGFDACDRPRFRVTVDKKTHFCPIAGNTTTEISPTSSDAPRATIQGMGRIVWSVRQGRKGELDAHEILSGYRSESPVHEPKLGDVLRLPDGSGPWRVIDWALADRVDASGNVLVVERVY